MSRSPSSGPQARILQVYTQRLRASTVLQYTLEHLEKHPHIILVPLPWLPLSIHADSRWIPIVNTWGTRAGQCSVLNCTGGHGCVMENLDSMVNYSHAYCLQASRGITLQSNNAKHEQLPLFALAREHTLPSIIKQTYLDQAFKSSSKGKYDVMWRWDMPLLVSNGKEMVLKVWQLCQCSQAVNSHGTCSDTDTELQSQVEQFRPSGTG